jgi:hypothetical protein
MKLLNRVWVVSLFLLMIAALIPRLNALEPYVKLYPSEGTVYTNIFLEYRAEIFPFLDQYASQGGIWIYWDNMCLASGVKGNFASPPVYGLDYSFTAPNDSPYNDIGFHNVTLKVWSYDSPQQPFVFNATFEITEYVPCDEYLTLNATYYSLLANCTALSINYSNLQNEYNILTSNYSSLQDNYNSLLGNYSSLSGSYQSLNITYYSLLETYNLLRYDSDNLSGSYDSLNASYDSLQSSYNSLVRDMTTTRNIEYLFIGTTTVLVATTVYFALRKPRQVH